MQKIPKSDNFPSEKINKIPKAVFLMKKDKGWFKFSFGMKLSHLFFSNNVNFYLAITSIFMSDLKLFDAQEGTSTTASNPTAQGKEFKKILFPLKYKYIFPRIISLRYRQCWRN